MLNELKLVLRYLMVFSNFKYLLELRQEFRDNFYDVYTYVRFSRENS